MTSKIQYNIISTGSKGNATVIEESILIDCGVPFKKLSPYVKNLNLVLLTHIHTDHFNKATIKRLAAERPTLRFGCCKWLVSCLIDCGVNKKNIDVYEVGTSYKYGSFVIIAFPLIHNVLNCGYKINFTDIGKMIYATDTSSLDNISAKSYDLYMIETNYDDAEMQERIQAKEERGEYVYEYDVLKNHLSQAKCDEWILKNIDETGVFIRMHQHEDKING